jgi:NAD(P)-dependent dehydrogenase (short-subunit alcohol dehydrogenase family)
MDPGRSGRRAVVTGASRGIGRAMARQRAREGMDVAVVRHHRDATAAAGVIAAGREGGAGLSWPTRPTPARGVHDRRGHGARRDRHPGQHRAG